MTVWSTQSHLQTLRQKKTPGSDEREEIHTCKLGILRLKLVSLVPVSSAMHNQLERGTVLA